MQIALDVDATVFRFHAAMALLPGCAHISADRDTYWGSIAASLPGGEGELIDLFKTAFTYRHMRRAGLFEGAREEIAKLAADGVRVHVMTRRLPGYAADTQRFLVDEGLVFDEFTCQDPFDKIALCQRLGIDVIVDDHPETIEAAHAAGMRALTLLYPFNRETVQRLGIEHASHWRDLGPMVAAACLTGAPA